MGKKLQDNKDIKHNQQVNSTLIREFERLLDQIKFDIDMAPSKTESMANYYRLKQIKNSLDIIKKYPKKITSGSELEHIKGIGKGTIQRINEILETGKLNEIKLDITKQEYLKTLATLEQVFGIGPKTAHDLVTKYNIKSIQDLKDAYKNHKIELSTQILTGLEYLDKYKENIPRAEITNIDKYLLQITYELNPKLFHLICGSYRRQKPTSNDIDVLISHPAYKTKKDIHKAKNNLLLELVKKLKQDKFLLADLTDKDPEVKYMGFCKFQNNPIRRIDIRFIPNDSWATGVLYFTGPGDFNRKMRELAGELGYKLNEFGLFKITQIKNKEVAKLIPTSYEKEIFDLLGMEYLPPELRY